MKVIVDTRRDSLDEALATVRAAFGASGDFPNAGSDNRDQTPKVAARNAREVKGAEPAPRAAAAPASKRSPAKRPPAGAKSSRRNRTKRTDSMIAASNIAPPGQADAIRSWARARGMDVKQAGRLPATVIRAYRESSQG